MTWYDYWVYKLCSVSVHVQQYIARVNTYCRLIQLCYLRLFVEVCRKQLTSAWVMETYPTNISQSGYLFDLEKTLECEEICLLQCETCIVLGTILILRAKDYHSCMIITISPGDF